MTVVIYKIKSSEYYDIKEFSQKTNNILKKEGKAKKISK
jgi:hypothetical protein